MHCSRKRDSTKAEAQFVGIKRQHVEEIHHKCLMLYFYVWFSATGQEITEISKYIKIQQIQNS